MSVRYLVDTNILIPFFQGRYNVRDNMLKHDVAELGISEITLAELTYGAYHSSNFEKHINEVYLVRDSFSVFRIKDCFDEYGSIRDCLTRQGITVENFDLLIAATAVHYNLILVTENIKHFNNIPNLKLENWVERT